MLPTDIKAKLYIDHLVLTVRNIDTTADFYAKIFGKPDYQDKYQIMYHIGQTKLFLCLPHGTLPQDDKFNANRIGLEHFAVGVQTVEQLQAIQKALDSNSIRHSGIHIDKHSNKEKVWLNDPDGIRLEFYIRPK